MFFCVFVFIILHFKHFVICLKEIGGKNVERKKILEIKDDEDAMKNYEEQIEMMVKKTKERWRKTSNS